jgi:hypothetical protein
MSNLTTLANVKAWLGMTSVDPARDAMVTRVINAQSRFIESWLSRVIQSQSYNEVRDGGGYGESRFALTFANNPVSSVGSVEVNGIVIPPSPDGGVQLPGYGFDASTLWLAPVGPYFDRSATAGYVFIRGKSNVLISYTGGFLVLPLGQTSTNRWLLPAEQQVIPATPYQITTQSLWTSDNGVQFVSDSSSLVKVTGTPTAGQYTVGTVSGVPGVYTFAAADTGKAVALSYGYVPADIEQVCIDLVSVSFKGKDRVGLVSQAVGTESVTYYLQKDMPAWAATALQQYKRVFTI